jgi:hypothetical protein
MSAMKLKGGPGRTGRMDPAIPANTKRNPIITRMIMRVQPSAALFFSLVRKEQ